MSSRASSNKKQKQLFNEPSDILFDPFFGFKPRESFIDIPWPEWNDADLNAEIWGETKLKPTAEKKQSTATKLTAQRLFEDLNPSQLPLEIREYVDSWKRPQEVFPNVELTVYNPENLWFKLKIPSPVGECNILNRFNNILPILQYYGKKYNIPVEMENITFTNNNPLEPWRPWHHIYSLNKVGKGLIHKPLYNPYGKYVLRLFYFGSWRKFTIDDKIPCDKYGNCMLPVSQVQGELWPLLLAKGLLKIIYLTPSCDMSAIDFPLISCLTAWTHLRLTTLNKTQEEIWRRFRLLTFEYHLPEEQLDEKSKKNTAMTDSTKNKQTAIIGSTKSKMSKELQVPKTNIQDENFCFLFATLGGFTLDFSDLNDQFVLIIMNRDIPLVKADKKDPTKPWKRFRWVDWALEKGIWVDELLLPPYRRLLCISFNEKLPTFFAPDPIQELTMYNLPNEYVSNEEINQLLLEENGILQPEHWLDFNKFYEYLSVLNVFFKPSCFKSIFKITYAAPAVPNKLKNATISGSAVPKALPQNLYVYSPFLTPTLNQPPLLFCQCFTECFLCVSLWVCPQKEKLSLGYLDPEQPEILKIGHASLIMEDYDWRNLVQGKILGVIKTVGNSSMYVNLTPGRHILKLWLSSDSPFILNIYSSVDIFVQKGPKIRYQMSNESNRILNYIGDISEAFINLSQSFGKQEYREVLQNFYKILKSGLSKSINHSIFESDFIDLFLNSVMSELKNLITNVEELKIMLNALRSLFLNLRIKCVFPQKAPASIFSTSTKKTLKKGGKGDLTLKERSLSQIVRHPWTSKEIQQIVMIQRIFRGFRVRLLLQCQTPLRKEFKFFTEKLKKICDLIFSSSKRENVVGKIIRQIIKINSNLYNIFRFRDDFSQVLNVEEYTGKIPSVEAYAWVPLVRFTIALHSDEPEPCAFYLHCNLEQYFLVGVDNDTDEEIFLLTNILSPHYYKKNVNGYTIFGYAWNGANPKTVNWRLEMVTMKWFQGVHLCDTLLGPECHSYTLPPLEMIEVKNFYIPNQSFKICRCFIVVKKKSNLALRFSTSYLKAKFNLTVFLEKKTKTLHVEKRSLHDKSHTICKASVASIVNESYSENGAVLIPSLILDNIDTEVSGEGGEGENITKYILEAYVIENSWPLTKHEWGVIEPIRMNGESTHQNSSFIPPKKERTESRRRTSRMSRRSFDQKNVENPCWQLQIVNNLGDGEVESSIIVGEEKVYSDSMKAIKKFWEKNDPGRRNRGREMRLKFLNSLYMENFNKRKSKLEYLSETKKSNSMMSSSNIDNENFFEDMIHKMNSFSYLLNSKSPTRYLKSPKVLPEMPTNELIKQYERKEKDESLNDWSIYEEVEENIESEIEEREREFWDEKIHYRQVMINHFLDEQKLSEILMEEAYKLRLKVIKELA